MTPNRTVTVFGAYGHTGRFVVAELRNRGWTPVLSGRDPEKLKVISSMYRGFEARPASVDQPASLDRALAGAAAVINCAGPFAETSAPLIEAALRARIPYLDVTAEVEVAAAELEEYGDRARERSIVVVPAMAFYGGLGDLLATAAMAEWSAADQISIAYALDSWKPTPGTRATGQTSRRRRGGRRLVFANHRLELRDDSAPTIEWGFPAPFGTQTVQTEFTTAATVLISRHLKTDEIRSYMTIAPLKDLADPNGSGPVAVDQSGRSSQTFLVEAVARRGTMERRAIARGRDIYAITAPIVVEATRRILHGSASRPGAVAAGEVFDAQDFLRSLSPAHLSYETQMST